MKAMLPREKVLLYRLESETEKGSKLREALAAEKIGCAEIGADGLDTKLGRLAEGGTPEEASGEAAPDCELMVLCNFSRNRLDRFLSGLSRRGIDVGLKAVLTAYNRDWTVRHLIGELEKEKEHLEAAQTQKEIVT